MTSSSYNLTFSRLRASFTVDKELIGKQDPYVIFTSGSAKAQTKAIKGVGTGTAEWKESYTLEKFSPSSNSIIEVNVWNHNTLLPDNIIGSGTVDLSSQGQSSLSGSGDPVSVILVDKKGQETGTLSFVVNGGGYSGSGTGRSGVSSGTGVTSGTGVGTGGYSGSNTGYSGSNTGYSGSNTGAGNDGTLVGKGYGTSQSTAQRASDQAAATGKTAILEEKSGLGVGHPVQTGSSGKGLGSSSTTSDYSSTRGTGTGITSGTGVTSGTGTGITSGTTGVAVRGVAAGDRTVYGEREGDIIDRKYYVGTESRPQDQALVETYREHNPYAKDYETTVQHTGRERLVQSQIEALGTRERVVTQDHLVYAHPHHEIARHLPAGALSERPGGEGWVQTKAGPICDTNTFSISGDRTVDKERVTDLREHREFEKEFEVKTRLVGERLLTRGTEAEILNRERVLVDEKSKIACEGHPAAAVSGGETLASTGYTGTGTTTGAGYSSSGTNTGYSGTGTGIGSGTGSGYNNSGRNTTGQTTGEKIASYIPGSEENKEKKGQTTGSGYGTGQTTGSGYGTGQTTGSGYGTGQTTGSGYGTGQTTGSGYGQSGQSGTGQTTGEKIASYVPGSEENKEKKAAQYA